MAMFSLYCDDSGTHFQSDIAIAACYVATVDQWKEFNRNWEEANQAEHFGVFHMADFVARKEQFASPEWQDDEKRHRTLCRLINIIVTRARYGFYSVLEKKAYDEEVPQDLKNKRHLGDNHYTFAIWMCLGKVLKWRRKYSHQEPIEFVFDQMSKGKGEINNVFNRFLEEDREAALMENGIYPGGWAFKSKSTDLPLQAADILAWESLHHMLKVHLPEKRESPRASYAELLRVPTDKGIHDRESLRKWVEYLREKTNGKW